jgi:tetratricopeptide (TPR) repeat protein
VSMGPDADPRIRELGRASRRAALISILGFVLVLGAIAHAMIQLQRLQAQVDSLTAEREQLREQIQRSTTVLDSVRTALVDARRAVGASRAAINAFHAGDLELAVALYDESLMSDPSNAYIQNLRAYALFRLGRVEEAIEGQRRSIAADSSYAWGYFDLARFLCAVQPPQMENARRAAETALSLRPDLRQIMAGDGEFQRICQRRIP